MKGSLSIAVFGLAFLLNTYAGHGKPIKVACVGDSITLGYGGSKGADYPSVLQGLLGDGYEVKNFGYNGATMQKAGTKPYWNTKEWGQALNSNADIVVIMLGTNDAKPINWKHDGVTGPKFFEADYKDMISQLRKLKTYPALYTAIPPPCYKDYGPGKQNMTIVNKLLPPLIKKINDDMKLPHPPIDLFEGLGGAKPLHPDWFQDSHPNDQGYAEIAKVVYASLAPPRRRGAPGRQTHLTIDGTLSKAANEPAILLYVLLNIFVLCAILGLSGLYACIYCRDDEPGSPTPKSDAAV